MSGVKGGAMKALMLIAALLVPDAAWAEAWVFIVPPRVNTDKGRVTDTKAPIGQWQQLGAFDTARECEATKSRAAEVIGKGSPDWYSWYNAGRCMPYDLWWKTQQPSR